MSFRPLIMDLGWRVSVIRIGKEMDVKIFLLSLRLDFCYFALSSSTYIFEDVV